MRASERAIPSVSCVELRPHPPTPLANRVAHVVVGTLLSEQIVTAMVGTLGALRPELSSFLLHGLIVGQLAVGSVGLGACWRIAGTRLARPRAFIVIVCYITVASIVKNVDVSPTSSLLDLSRLAMPLLWMAILPIDDLAAAIIEIASRRRWIILVLLIVELIGVVIGRATGWGAAYLSGDPVVILLVVPALLAAGGRLVSIAAILVSLTLVGESLKRTAWISIGLTVLLLGAYAAFTGSVRRVLRALLVGAALLALAYVGVASTNVADQVRLREASFAAALAGKDVSATQRIDELRLDWSRVEQSPATAALFGLSSADMLLPNGIQTHAIHNTLAFLVFAGGVAWLGALLVAGRPVTTRLDWPTIAVAIAALGVVVDSLGGNMALAPSFGVAMAVLSGASRQWIAGWRRVSNSGALASSADGELQRRALVRNRELQHVDVVGGSADGSTK